MVTNKVEPIFSVLDLSVRQEWGIDVFEVTVIDERGYTYAWQGVSIAEALGRAVLDIVRARRDEQNWDIDPTRIR